MSNCIPIINELLEVAKVLIESGASKRSVVETLGIGESSETIKNRDWS